MIFIIDEVTDKSSILELLESSSPFAGAEKYHNLSHVAQD